MKYKKIILVICMVFMNNIMFGQIKQYDYESQETKTEIEHLIDQFKPLIDRLPTYKKYSPCLYSMNKNNEVGIQMLSEEKSPKDIEKSRSNYAKIFESNKSMSDKKLILTTFISNITNPINKKNTKSIVIYVEHLKESKGYIYYYPYKKTIFGKVKLLNSLNFREEINKLVLK